MNESAAIAELVLVATPIGNLGDLSPRAAEELSNAALICCEDTRRTGRLLAHIGRSGARLAVCNEHTEAAVVDEVLATLGAGGRVAVVTDAGTPAISDPGARLVRAVLDAGFEVTSVPGPAAVVAALTASGLPTSRFVFEGFLPRSGKERQQRLAEIAAERRTVVVYEAPHRIERTIADLLAVCGGDRAVAVGRELTKRFETWVRGPLGDIELGEPRGEYVVVVGPSPSPAAPTDEEIETAIDAALGSGQSTRDTADRVAEQLGIPRRAAYAVAVERKQRADGARR